jgi:hypothetical protein
MRTTTRRRVRRLALVMVAAPVATWALEQAAQRTETRDSTSPTSRRLRQGADVARRFGRGPLASRLGRRPVTRGTLRNRQPQPGERHHG